MSINGDLVILYRHRRALRTNRRLDFASITYNEIDGSRKYTAAFAAFRNY